MNKEKKRAFMADLHKIYNKKTLNLKEQTKKEILNQYKKLDQNSTNIAYASYALYPLIREESYQTKDKDLEKLLKFLEKNKWKAYFGMVLGSAFAR